MPFFENSKNVFISGGNFIDASVDNYALDSGIKLLLESSLLQAVHNSYARNPPQCHPGTREEYIRDITGWGSGEWKTREARALWMRGPAGVGKSALAQTCAEGIEESGRLGATFFFFRPNGWNDPDKFIPTIVYQLTTKYPAYRDVVDAIILRDPLVLETSLDVQFQELLVKPFRELSANGHAVGMDAVIIVDGLDECKTTTAQHVIIELVTTSIQKQTTPFLWAFFSRPEPHIVAAFSSVPATQVSWQLTLPISRDVDSDIEGYLRDGFRIIRAKYGLPRAMTWPSEEDIRSLVDQSSGLFVYAATAIRYIGQDVGIGYEAQLRLVLELGQRSAGSGVNPFRILDRLYTLVMTQIPEAGLPITLSLLYLRLTQNWTPEPEILYYCLALGLSLMDFHTATNNLHSVLEITKSQQGMPLRFSFYHASFTDFLSDPTRSSPMFCVDTPDIRQRCLTTVINSLHRSSITADILPWSDPEANVERAHLVTLRYLFSVAAHPDVHLGEDTMRQLSQFTWSKWQRDDYPAAKNIEEFIIKIPRSWRSKFIRPFRRGPLNVVQQIFSNLKQGGLRSRDERRTYVVGTGSNKALLVPDDTFYHLRPYPKRH